MGKRKLEEELVQPEDEGDDVEEFSGDEEDDEDFDEEEELESGEGEELEEADSGIDLDEEEDDGDDELDEGISGSDIDDAIMDDEFEGASGSDISEAEEEDEDEAAEESEEEKKEDAYTGIGSAFSRAFSSIMKKKIPQSELTDSLGPVLAERKQLLVKKLEEEENDRKVKIDIKKKKRQEREKGHTLPQTYTDAKEKALIKLATTGVVRLFNAVSKAQKVQADADISSSKAAKATWKQSKQAFMTQLRGGPKDEQRTIGGSEKTREEEEEAGWSALKDDFMLGTAKMKDWDKNPEEVEA